MSKKKIKILDSKSGYNLAAANYDKKEKYLNSFEQGKIFELLGEIKNKEVLDVGAGTGRLTNILVQKGAKVTAMDISKKMLDVLRRKNPLIKTIIGGAENLPFKDKIFDLVISTFLIIHLKDLTKFFNEVCRVLKDDGYFLLTNINQKEAPEIDTVKGLIKIESHYHRPEKARKLLEESAFNIEKEIFVREKDVWINQILFVRK
ncbi:MAG: class I SAM-dependent methyltransferase [Patescibacteria group bacterium]